MSGRVHRGTSRKPKPQPDQDDLVIARVRAGVEGPDGVWGSARHLVSMVEGLRARVAELEAMELRAHEVDAGTAGPMSAGVAAQYILRGVKP